MKKILVTMILVWCFFALSTHGGERKKAAQQKLPAEVTYFEQLKKQMSKEQLKIYLPLAASNDHMVVGMEIPGYHMRYDLAQPRGIFMILLPNGFEWQDTPVYFAINTFAFDGWTVKSTLHNDIKGIKEADPNLKIVRDDLGKELKSAGECYGAEVEYAKEEGRPFPYERFYFCNSRSKKYALFLSVSARSKKELDKRLNDFIFWADLPQIVVDEKIVTVD